MKRLVYTLISSVMVAIFISFNAFAMPYHPYDVTSPNELSSLLPPGVKQSKATENAIARGNFFARADLIVSNDGGGKVGALAIGYMRFPVDKAYITIYLDQLDEVEERWKQVKYYEAEFYAEDYPDGLITPTVDISFINQTKGCYYRLRSSFAAYYNGDVESFSPTTNGVLLD